MHINMNTGVGYEEWLFPDGQPHVRLNREVIIKHKSVNVTCSITSSDKLLELQMMVNAIKNHHMKLGKLFIPYLMGARYDRLMDIGDSYDLEVIAGIINSLKFQEVVLLDPHSDVSFGLIKRRTIIDNRLLVGAYKLPEAVLIIPDLGASKKAHNYIEKNWNTNLVTSIQVTKYRDINNFGAISIDINPVDVQTCHGRNCVIIDDLCDGGGTFISLAKILGLKNCTPLTMTLIVTHGIFSKGLSELSRYFNKIITSNSYPHKLTSSVLETIQYDI